MATSARHGFGRIITKLAIVSLLVAGFDVSAAMNKYEVAADEEFAFVSPNDSVNANSYELIVNAGSATTVYYPPSGNFNCFVYLKGSGSVTFKKPGNYNGGDQVSFVVGVAAESTVTMVVKDVATVNVGNSNPTYDINYPVVDVANMTFEQTSGKLRIIDKTTVRALPSSFEVVSGSTVALQGDNPLRLGSSFTLTNYDVVVLNRASVPNGCTITVPPGRTLALSLLPRRLATARPTSGAGRAPAHTSTSRSALFLAARVHESFAATPAI